MRTLPLVLALVLSAPAGIVLALSSSAPPAMQTPLGDGATAPWSLDDCFFAYALAPVTAEALGDRIPPGFLLRPPVPVNLAGAAREATAVAAYMGFEIDVCESGDGLSGGVAPMQYASAWVGAHPPLRMQDPASTGHFLVYDILVPDADRRAWLASAGAPVHDGGIVVTRTDVGFRAEWTLDGIGGFAMDVATSEAPPSTPFSGRFTQFQPTSEGKLVRWSTDWAATETWRGVATLEVPEGSWYADVLGATTLPAQSFHGAWSYTGGDIELPS
jgi:hypothetical protein